MAEGTGWRIGRLGAVQIRLDVTWFLFAYALVVVTWHSAARSSDGYGIVASVVVVLTFVATLVIHEGTHLLVARRFGRRPDRVALWALGGRSNLVGDAPPAGASVVVALSGTVVSAAVGATLLFAARSMAIGHPRHELTIVGRISVLIAAINLVPAYWTDGNDVLRAIVGKLTGDPERAWRIAARTGQIVAAPLAFGLWLTQPWKETVLPIAAPVACLYTVWVAGTELRRRSPDDAEDQAGAEVTDGEDPNGAADPA